MIRKFTVFLVVASLHLCLKSGQCFDTTLDTHKEVRRWKFHGNYTYANTTSSHEIKQLRVPEVMLQAPANRSDLVSATGEFEREGIWLIKHDPQGANKWNMTYSLSHLLFSQGWVTLLAHPNVAVVFKTSGNIEVGRFWSNGKAWCDAVFNIGLRNTFTAEVRTPKIGEYALIDKVVLGIMGNITALKKKKIDNPCLTEGLSLDNTPPDMEVKPEAVGVNNELRRQSSDETPPDMEDKSEIKNITTTPSSRTQPLKSTGEASMREYQTERGGAKCDCICTCTKPTSAPTANNNTTTPSSSGGRI